MTAVQIAILIAILGVIGFAVGLQIEEPDPE